MNEDSSDIESPSTSYRISIPRSDDYAISLAINPCGVNNSKYDERLVLGYDCCMNHYPVEEYDEVDTVSQVSNFNNYDAVNENGRHIPYKNSKYPDEHIVLDERCEEEMVPFYDCAGPRSRKKRSNLMPACSDNNQTVDASLNCHTPNGFMEKNCMQVGYFQNAFIHVQMDDYGTFLEIHKPYGSAYDGEYVILGSKRILTRKTDGMITTSIPLTYKNDSSRLLCALHENRPTIGATVTINDKAQICCCPEVYSHHTQRGSFFCPIKEGTRNGPFAGKNQSTKEHLDRDRNLKEYPLCPDLEEGTDEIFCSRNILDDLPEGAKNPLLSPGRFYSVLCEKLSFNSSSFTFGSNELDGLYFDKCHIGDGFAACAEMGAQEKCVGHDEPFSFYGETGTIFSLPGESSEKYGISFNNGRTKYFFDEDHFDLVHPRNNYELWFVQRTRREKIILMKKPFQVTWPPCTFDALSDEYFPYAII
eukprot:CAMPEP_0116019990 /NCGR_PEP_ID=MMETSP0321-20121206/9546_1 /TAXON_ID=163516 /ORGANISM="Leptocylindrus danicus var. danicus, Strain B650" /LENGTH=475 /DNA_ID=CAMNT_0003490627 /DNA_START=154 /DNA_END=1581 /DNA_ORIENTATION=-